MAVRMPAEWEAHDWLWIGFPWNPDEWGGPSTLARAQEQIAIFADAVRAGPRGEEVRLVCNDEASATHAQSLLIGNIDIVVEPIGDIWLRDTGPIALIDEAGNRSLVDFRFNGWGGKYKMLGDEDIGRRLATSTDIPCQSSQLIFEGGAVDTDGSGLFVTTEQCLLNPNRNRGKTRREMEACLAENIGLTDMLWLSEGLINDHTDGHVDNLARFVAPGILAIPHATTHDDPNAALYADAAARAKAHGLTVAPMPSPGRMESNGVIAPASYMNFVIGNGTVVVPAYDRPNDAAMVEALRPFFPERTLVSLPSDAILAGGGSFHCTSQQMPTSRGSTR